ncbi:MAG TPA: nucleotide exchange factor GrpE [Candidatus Limnocylindria bacterium]|nr:nucleotide exchange factor GrpE [Candidatus Limnocylindria bacterium]
MTDPTNGGGKPHTRTRTRAEERAEAVKTPSRVELIDRIETLERELSAATAQAEEHLSKWQRSAADFANFKRRTEEERTAVNQFSTALLLTKLLNVLDDFDRALESVPPEAHDAWIEGVKLVERKLRSVLESEGVTPIEAVGQPFDPNVHEAVVHEPTAEHPDNQVIGEVQRGYLLHDRVLRPSLVRVANNPKEQ